MPRSASEPAAAGALPRLGLCDLEAHDRELLPLLGSSALLHTLAPSSDCGCAIYTRFQQAAGSPRDNAAACVRAPALILLTLLTSCTLQRQQQQIPPRAACEDHQTGTCICTPSQAWLLCPAPTLRLHTSCCDKTISDHKNRQQCDFTHLQALITRTAESLLSKHTPYL